MVDTLASWLPQASATGVLLAAVWLVLAGKIVPKALHDEVRTDRDTYRMAAETALKAATEAAGSVQQLTAAVEKLATTQRETLDLVRRLVPTEPPTERAVA